MAQVSLSKALKLKNKQARRVSDLRKRIEQYNSVAEGVVRPFDIEQTYRELLFATDRLVEIKAAINGANAPIQDKIYRMAELRGLAVFLRNLNPQEGPAQMFYGSGAAPVYTSVLNAAHLEVLLESLEAEIDVMQDEVDTHNATVRIEVTEG